MDEEDKTNDDLEMIADEDSNAALPDAQKKIKQLKEELRKCDAERQDYLAGWQRAKADHINYKNEEGKRLEDMARFITAGIVQEIMPVLDSFAALEFHFKGESRPAAGGRDPALEKGILLIRSQFEDILRKRGLEQIKVEVGDQFDPEKHEAIGEIETDLPEGSIAEEVQKGYFLKGKVLRPVRVRLAKSKK